MKKGEKNQVSVEPEKEKTVINVWRQEKYDFLWRYGICIISGVTYRDSTYYIN